MFRPTGRFPNDNLWEDHMWCVGGSLWQNYVKSALWLEAIAVNFAPAVRPDVFPGLQFWRLRIWRLAPPKGNFPKTNGFRENANCGFKILAGAAPEALKLQSWSKMRFSEKSDFPSESNLPKRQSRGK